MFRTIYVSILAFLLLFGAAGCAKKTEAAQAQAPVVTISENTIILDARTPEEHADGYMEGAKLLDFRSGEFEAAVPTLDPDATYLVYCKSGNRAGQAAALMNEAGIKNVTNLGSLEEAAVATGQSIVSP